jgi:uncharacterized protein involved in exopolysaccharide biosynthesis
MRDLAADDISVRELYLTLRRGLPLIVVAALFTAGIALVYQGTRPTQYRASATSLLTVPPVQIDGGGSINVQPNGVVTFETYRALALSRPVLETALAAVDRPGIGIGTLRRQATLDALIEPDTRQQITTLSVVHEVGSDQADTSAALAQAWVEATLATVRATLIEDLAPIAASSDAERTLLSERLDLAEAALERFSADDDGGALALQRERMTEALVEGDLRLGDLEVQRRVLTTQSETLERQLTAAGATVAELTPFDDDLYAGRSLSQILEIAEAQARGASQERAAAEAALDDFDREHDLALATERLNGLRRALASAEGDLTVLDSQLAATAARRDALNVELDRYPPTLALNDTAIAGDLQGIAFSRDTINPLYTDTASLLGAVTADLAALQVRRSSLEHEVADLLPRIGTLDDELIGLSRQRSVLEERLRLAIGADADLRRRVVDLTITGSATEGDPVLRSDDPEVRALATQLRATELEHQAVLSETEALIVRQRSDSARLTDLRRRSADLDRRRTALEREVALARDAFEDVVAVQPALSYLARVLPSGVRILSPAIVPQQPVPTRNSTQVTVAALLGAVLATLFILLRRAVAPDEDAVADVVHLAPDPLPNPHVTSETMA